RVTAVAYPGGNRSRGREAMSPYRAKAVTLLFLASAFGVSGAVSTSTKTAWSQVPEKDDGPPLRTVTFRFTGKVAHVDDPGGLLNGSVGLGSKLTGAYTFDPGTPDSNKDPTVGDYWHKAAGYGLLVKVGKYEFKTDPAKVNFLLEVVDRPRSDSYLLRSYNNVSSGPRLPADAIDHISWH